MRLEAQPAKIGRGNAVLHPQHGIGKVQSVSEADFDGANGTKFARLFFKREALTLFLPLKDAAEAVRQPVNREQARQILDHVETCTPTTRKQWKARAAEHEEVLGRCDPFECAEVFKGLQHLDAEGSLRHTDRAHLNQAMDFLADELSYALGKSPDKVRQIITRAAGEAKA
ncbi:MAG: CarD family transcriptional regulator [Lysobacterales bacterium]|jgi:RNA polymerase-interacting CarD/CdnL/TRCF family regulator